MIDFVVAVESRIAHIGRELEALSLRIRKQLECTGALEVDWLALGSFLDSGILPFVSESMECTCSSPV